MDSSIIHELWKLVESTSMRPLLELNDTELITFLTDKIQQDHHLSQQQAEQFQAYAADRVLLIRDLAWSRILV